MRTVLLAIALVIGSGVVPAMADVWSRREDCIQLGQKKLEKQLTHYKGKDEAKYDWKITMHTRYDAEKGHCYVVIEGGANSGVTFTQLYDGQTDELLVNASAIWDRSNGELSFFGEIDDGGYVHDLACQVDYKQPVPALELNRCRYAAAMDYINRLMTEKR